MLNNVVSAIDFAVHLKIGKSQAAGSSSIKCFNKLDFLTRTVSGSTGQTKCNYSKHTKYLAV